MRMRLSTLILSLVSLCMAQIPASLASAQAETEHSTIRLASATEPVTGPAFSQQYSTSSADDPSPEPNAVAPNNQPQASTSPRSVPATNYSSPPLVEAQPKMHSRPLTNPYATSAGQAAMNRMPHPMPVQSIPTRQPTRLRGKPFSSVQSEPAISPYLNLYRNDSSQNQLINYYTLVRPQLDQIDANKRQAADLQKLRSQVLNASQHPSQGQGATYDPSSQEGMTVSAHYMDTAQFYHRRK